MKPAAAAFKYQRALEGIAAELAELRATVDEVLEQATTTLQLVICLSEVERPGQRRTVPPPGAARDEAAPAAWPDEPDEAPGAAAQLGFFEAGDAGSRPGHEPAARRRAQGTIG